MRTYTVRLSRRDDGWDAGIEEVGSIRVERLTGVDSAVRAHLALLAFGDAGSARLRLDFGPQLERELRGLRDARAAAEAATRTAAERSRELAARLVAQGLRGAEVALVLGVTPQRVSQLLAAPPGDAGAAGAEVETVDGPAAPAKRARSANGARTAKGAKSAGAQKPGKGSVDKGSVDKGSADKASADKASAKGDRPAKAKDDKGAGKATKSKSGKKAKRDKQSAPVEA